MSGMDRVADFFDVPLELDVCLERRTIAVSELLALKPGSILATRVAAGEDAGLYLGGTRVGSGEVAAAGGSLIVRLTGLECGVRPRPAAASQAAYKATA